MKVLAASFFLFLLYVVRADDQKSPTVLYHLDKEDDGLVKAFHDKALRTLTRKADYFLSDYKTSVDLFSFVVRKQYLSSSPLYYLNFEAAYSYVPKSQSCPEKKPEVVSCTASLFKDSDDIHLQTYLTNPACQ